MRLRVARIDPISRCIGIKLVQINRLKNQLRNPCDLVFSLYSPRLAGDRAVPRHRVRRRLVVVIVAPATTERSVWLEPVPGTRYQVPGTRYHGTAR